MTVFGYITASLASFFIGQEAKVEDSDVVGAHDIAELRREIALWRSELQQNGLGAGNPRDRVTFIVTPREDGKFANQASLQITLRSDGQRVLVDRVWARGFEKLRDVIWLKDIDPSTDLRSGLIITERWKQFSSLEQRAEKYAEWRDFRYRQQSKQ